MGLCLRCKTRKTKARGYCNSCHQTLRKSGALPLKYPPMPDALTQEQAEVMTGLMLGDGHLNDLGGGKNRNACLLIARQARDAGYQQYTYDALRPFCWKPPVLFSKHDERTEKTYHGCRLTTRYAPVFTRLRADWYDAARRKRLPKHLKLTPLTCAIWFCDDGSVTVRNDGHGRLMLKLSTHCFTREENERLCRLLHEATGAKFCVTRDGEHSFINGYTATTLAFIDYIKEYVPKCMSRKLAFLERPEVQARLSRLKADPEAA